MMDFGRYGGYGRGMMGFGFGGLFVGLLCLIFFIALIVWIIRMVTGRRHGMGCGMHGMHGMYGMYDDQGPMHGMQDEALAILRKRFAGGDITKEEYDERLKALNGEKLP